MTTRPWQLLWPAFAAAWCGLVAGVLITDARSFGIAIAAAFGAVFALDFFARLERSLAPETESERRITAQYEAAVRAERGEVG